MLYKSSKGTSQQPTRKHRTLEVIGDVYGNLQRCSH